MVTELETKTENVWMQHNNFSDHFIIRKWQKRHGGKNVMVAKTSWWQKRCGGKNGTWD